MSKVAIKGNASGTGTFTLEAPNSNTDRTLVLPDEAGTVLTSGTAASSIPGYGSQITEVDVWQITDNTDLTSDTSTVIETYWSQSNNTRQGLIGTGMSQSSGVFTFPSTGIWRVEFLTTLEKDGSVRQIQMSIEVSDDGGSTWDLHSMANAHITSAVSNDEYSNANTVAVVDVNNTSNVKVRFKGFSNDAASKIVGTGTYLRSGAIFTRLGGT